MKPAPFPYARPRSLADALELLGVGDDDVKLLAGGQNPLIVEGMVHGSTVHGIGAALLEEFRYDEQGQLLIATFLDYLKPTAADVPTIEVEGMEHPSPFTPLGAKGVGEGGAIPGPAAVANAVEDALAPFGVTIRDLPITPERVWRWIRLHSESLDDPR